MNSFFNYVYDSQVCLLINYLWRRQLKNDSLNSGLDSGLFFFNITS